MRLTINMRTAVRELGSVFSRSSRAFGESDSSKASITQYKGKSSSSSKSVVSNNLCHMRAGSAFSSLRPWAESSIKMRLKAGMSLATWNAIDLKIALKDRFDWSPNLKKKYWHVIPESRR